MLLSLLKHVPLIHTVNANNILFFCSYFVVKQGARKVHPYKFTKIHKMVRRHVLIIKALSCCAACAS